MTKDFKTELTHLLNKHSIENGTNTPDFILAELICQNLQALGDFVRVREEWHGREFKDRSAPIALGGSLSQEPTI